jgi:hypothetical protein|uniref:Uncharacterized protein n=1 Tax=viral metagenome TaxID=1070528 RepID=A0A6C0ICY4_9ZZZZ
MGIHTSAIFYSRGVPNTYNNFAFVAQANNIIPAPMTKYTRSYNFYNRNITNTNIRRIYPWNN